MASGHPITPALLESAANTDNATVVSAAPCLLMKIRGVNHAAATRYLKLYNKATAPSAADTPLDVVEIPVSALPFDVAYTANGELFSKGLSYRIVTGAADSDNTAVTAGDITMLSIGYARR